MPLPWPPVVVEQEEVVLVHVGLNKASDGNNDGSEYASEKESTLLSSLLTAIGLLTQVKHGSWRFFERRARSLGLGLGLPGSLLDEAEFWCRRSSVWAAGSRIPATLALRSDTKRRRVSSVDDGGHSDVLSSILPIFWLLGSRSRSHMYYYGKGPICKTMLGNLLDIFTAKMLWPVDVRIEDTQVRGGLAGDVSSRRGILDLLKMSSAICLFLFHVTLWGNHLCFFNFYSVSSDIPSFRAGSLNHSTRIRVE